MKPIVADTDDRWQAVCERVIPGPMVSSSLRY
jgi:hypothetical protein